MTNEILKQMISRIAEQFLPRRVILFGSYATGEATDESDVDFLVISDDGRDTRDTALAIRKSLGDFPIGCDIIVSREKEYQRSRMIVNHIAYLADRYGKVVYER